MATTLNQLATRVLRKLKVLAANAAPDPADQALAVEKLNAAHAAFSVQELAPWTLSNIPTLAEEPYVLMGAFLAASDFETEADPTWPVQATTELQRAANLKACGIVPAEYY